jgi:long-chain acyl-CoA synthetase
VYGLSLLHTHVAVGGSLVLETRFAFPKLVLDGMRDHAVTGFAGVPSTFAMLLHRSNLRRMSFPSLRYVTQAGGPMPPARVNEWLGALPGVPFFIMYGATEAAARLAYLPPSELRRRPGSIGRAIPNVELRVLRDDGSVAAAGEVGELVARGPNISPGYWNAPEETGARFGPDGYRTGDLAFADADGFLYLVGRRHDMIKVGAHRVSAKEIEETLHEHPSVHETAVIGVPHQLLGEVPVAHVVLREATDATEADLIAFCRARLAEQKVPARIVFSSNLPKSGAGKIDKRLLQSHAVAATLA